MSAYKPSNERLIGIAFLALLTNFVSSCCCSNPALKPDSLPTRGAGCKDWNIEESTLEFGGRKVYETRSRGRAVLLLHELPGMTPGAIDLALQLEDSGYKIYLPLMFGKVGEWSMKNLGRVLSNGDWCGFRANVSQPISADLAKLCKAIDRRHKGDGLVVIGNCLSGGVAIELLGKPEVRAAVANQAATPLIAFKRLSFLHSKRYKAAVGIDPDALENAIHAAAEKPGINLLAFRFTGDKLSPPEKLLHVQERFGDDFRGHVLSTSSEFVGHEKSNIHWLQISRGDDSHSVMTKDCSWRSKMDPDKVSPGQSEARELLIEFLDESFGD